MYRKSTAASFHKPDGHRAKVTVRVLQEAAAVATFSAAAFGAFVTGLAFFAAALRTAAHLFLVAATIALRPAALSLRFFGAAAFAVAA
jgi:hypothetical protein